MDESASIQVNFGKPMPLFPLPLVAAMPQQLVPLHVFEPRYKVMVGKALDGSGQLAMAVYARPTDPAGIGAPPIRPAVCIGQIVQHERLSDGRYNILLHGVCRACIVEEAVSEPGLPFREAILQPLGLPFDDDEKLLGLREQLDEQLSSDPLQHLSAATWLVERIRNEKIPISAVLELSCFTLLTDDETRYRLLAEPDVRKRRAILERELATFGRLVRAAKKQRADDWPKGMSWN